MSGFLKKAGLGIVLAATTLTAAMPAEAQRWGGRGGWNGGGRGWHGGRGGGDVAAGAILGGVLGLGVGAAIASSNNNRYYDRGYYNRGYYAPPPRAYYNAPPVAYYEDYRYQPRCYSQWRWDPYYGQNVQVRVCN